MGLASRGLRELDDVRERVTDPWERAALERQASEIRRRAAWVAAAAALGAILLP